MGLSHQELKPSLWGAEYPIEGNVTEIGGKKNHRVEVKIISPQQNFILSQSKGKSSLCSKKAKLVESATVPIFTRQPRWAALH
jgi:hypothetical protein